MNVAQPPVPERLKFKQRQSKRERPVEMRARVIVRELIEAGLPVNPHKLERLHGISHYMFDAARAAERARIEALTDLKVDPTAPLKPTAQAKVEIAKRHAVKEATADVAKRMRELDEEVRRRVLAESKEHLDYLAQEREEARQTEALYRELINNHKPVLTAEEFRLVLMCLHPDGERSEAKLQTAFLAFNAKKLQLTGQK
jgi:hypothetical protein